MIVSLTEMAPGESGTVTGAAGGHHLKAKLENLGILAGHGITKVSAQPFHGPVLVNVGTSQVAIGFRMAQKIQVEVSR